MLHHHVRPKSCYQAPASTDNVLLSRSHGALTPVDVVKTRIQLEPALGKLGMVGTARSIVANEGPKGLLTGFGPTAVGYLVQVSAPCA